MTKIYDKQIQRLVWDDCGLLGQTSRGGTISTQIAASDQDWQIDPDSLKISGEFQPIKSSLPGPANFLVLRLMNLTVMRVGFFNELVKKMMVRLLISGGGQSAAQTHAHAGIRKRQHPHPRPGGKDRQREGEGAALRRQVLRHPHGLLTLLRTQPG